jgi:CheY-like chemotaxis protein
MVPSGYVAELRVLVCDDVADTRDLIAEMVQMHGHQAELASDGASAIARILAGGLDVALIDIGLPDMSGYAVAHAVRSNPTAPPIWLVALTGYATAADHATATLAGFNEWFAKPVKMQVLLAALRRPELPAAVRSSRR